MKNKVYLCLLTLLFLTACSITLNSPPPPATKAAFTLVAATPALVGSTEIAPPETAPNPASTPPPWAALNLSGSLIYTQRTGVVIKLDLATGNRTELLSGRSTQWLAAAAVSPDSKTIVLTYTPPEQSESGYTGLYQIPGAGSDTEPQVIVERADPLESYSSPAWSHDGKYLYFWHLKVIRSDSGNTFKYTIERLEYPNGQPEVLLENAMWPRPSPDGTRLAYLKFDLEANTQELYLSDLDGQNPVPALDPAKFPLVDAQFFAPDGKTLIFNSASESASAFAPSLLEERNEWAWLDWLSGVQVAEAHSSPSDWWSITVGSDQPPVRLTHLREIGMYGDFSPDGKHIAFICASGLYIMKLDGSELTRLMPVPEFGTLEWIE